jgi:uncharacterized protein YbcV (DUF1398 family)
MSKAIENLQAAQKRALTNRPRVGGFPYLAETLRRAGVTRKRLVSAGVPEPISDQQRAGRDSEHAVGDRHDERSPV